MKTSLHRRQFVQLAGAAAGWAALTPSSRLAAADAAAPAASIKRDIRKAIMYGTIGVKGSVLEKLKAVRAAGFEGVEPNGGMDNDEVIKAMEAVGSRAG